MNPKDFKFNDDAFDDVFSSVNEDEFEDIYSNDNTDNQPDDNFAEEFEDIFSGKNSNPADEDDYEVFADDYFNKDSRVFSPESQRQSSVGTNVRKNPYSYNYNKAAQQKANRVSSSRFDDDISNELSSGRQASSAVYSGSVGKKIISVLLAAILIIVAVVGVGGFFFAKSLTQKVNYAPLEANQYISSAELAKKDGVKNILLVGVDARKGESNNSTRSDTMMLLTVDNNNRQIKLTSFLRDTYIEIPGYRWAKLNAAQSHGGTQLLVDTLEYNYGIDIDSYMLVNFDMFTTIIDSLGGIDVEVTEKEAKYINSQDHMTNREKEAFSEEIEAGTNHFTGTQALWYSRIRYLDNDFMRTQRQRKVLSSVLSKLKTSNPLALIDMLNKIVPMLETDLTSDEMTSLGLSSVKYVFYDVCQQSIPADGTWESGRRNGGQSVLLINLEKNRDILHNFVFNKVEKQSDGDSE